MKAIHIIQEVQLVDIDNTLEALQKAVDGYIECVYLDDRTIMLVNEEGALRGMPQNPIASLLAQQLIFGPALIVGAEGEDFTDVPEGVTVLLGLQN